MIQLQLDTYKFIENRPGFELIEIKNMKQHMKSEEIEIVAEMMIKRLSL